MTSWLNQQFSNGGTVHVSLWVRGKVWGCRYVTIVTNINITNAKYNAECNITNVCFGHGNHVFLEKISLGPLERYFLSIIIVITWKKMVFLIKFYYFTHKNYAVDVRWKWKYRKVTKISVARVGLWSEWEVEWGAIFSFFLKEFYKK